MPEPTTSTEAERLQADTIRRLNRETAHVAAGQPIAIVPTPTPAPPWVMALIVDLHRLVAELRESNRLLRAAAARDEERRNAK